MNLWIVNHYAKTPFQSGGTRHFIISRELVRMGHRVTILASSFDHATCRESHLEPGQQWKSETVDGVEFVWVRTPVYNKNDWRRMRNMLLFGRRLRSVQDAIQSPRPDVVWGSSPHLFAADAARRVASRYKVPFVLELRDPWPQILLDLGRMSPRHPVIKWMERIERRLYRSADVVLAVWPKMVDLVAERGGRRDRVHWIPNGIDFDAVPEPPVKEPSRRLVLMYAGKHGLANGLDVVLDAAKLLQQSEHRDRVEIQLVGSGPERARLVNRAADEQITMVKFREEVPKSDIFEVLWEADGFLMTLRTAPSFRYGNSPNKLFEYMAAARPVIFSVGSPYNPVAEAGAGVTVAPDDPRGLANGIEELLSISHDERSKMGCRGRQYVREAHDLKSLAARVEDVISREARHGLIRSGV